VVAEYRPGIRLTDVVRSVAELKPNADQHYVLIRREELATRRVQLVSVDLAAAWQAPQSEANPLLSPRDRIVVFDLEAGRQVMLNPILDELRLQAVSGEPTRIVRVSGRVNAPGEYPLEVGMTVNDLIRAGGGRHRTLIAVKRIWRYEVRDGQTRQTAVINDFRAPLLGTPWLTCCLRPSISVVKEISRSGSQETVRLEYRVKFPGEYPIERGETLRSVVTRAGD
jgi:protein involved in polysaccharide export with SLBB domain